VGKKWSYDGIYWLLRYARKNFGAWDDVEDVLADEAVMPREDDARLISAAPDLLAACEAASQWFKDYLPADGIDVATITIQGMVEDAIRKAKETADE